MEIVPIHLCSTCSDRICPLMAINYTESIKSGKVKFNVYECEYYKEHQDKNTNTGNQNCEQCEYFDISQKVFTIECYSCKRYYSDMFTHRNNVC